LRDLDSNVPRANARLVGYITLNCSVLIVLYYLDVVYFKLNISSTFIRRPLILSKFDRVEPLLLLAAIISKRVKIT
jgi:hypothetical protein